MAAGFFLSPAARHGPHHLVRHWLGEKAAALSQPRGQYLAQLLADHVASCGNSHDTARHSQNHERKIDRQQGRKDYLSTDTVSF